MKEAGFWRYYTLNVESEQGWCKGFMHPTLPIYDTGPKLYCMSVFIKYYS